MGQGAKKKSWHSPKTKKKFLARQNCLTLPPPPLKNGPPLCSVMYYFSLVLALSHLLWASRSPKTRQAECTKRLFKPFWTLVAQGGNLRLTKCSTKLLSGGGSGIGNFSSHRSTLVCKVVRSKEFCKISMRASSSSRPDMV